MLATLALWRLVQMARLLLVRVGWGKLRFGKGVEIFFNEPRRREGREGGEERGRFKFNLVVLYDRDIWKHNNERTTD